MATDLQPMVDSAERRGEPKTGRWVDPYSSAATKVPRVAQGSLFVEPIVRAPETWLLKNAGRPYRRNRGSHPRLTRRTVLRAPRVDDHFRRFKLPRPSGRWLASTRSRLAPVPRVATGAHSALAIRTYAADISRTATVATIACCYPVANASAIALATQPPASPGMGCSRWSSSARAWYWATIPGRTFFI